MHHKLLKQENTLHTELQQELASNKKIFSVELCSSKYIQDISILNDISPTFVSVTWHGLPCDSCFNYENIPAISLARKLHSSGHQVLVHLPGRYLSKEQALRVLEVLKSYNLRNIFAIQGGKLFSNTIIRSHNSSS